MKDSIPGRVFSGPSDTNPSGSKVPRSIMNAPDSLGDSIAGITAAGAGSAVAGAAAPIVAPIARAGMNVVRAHPIATTAALEVAKQIPGIGKYASKIPSWLPLMAGGEGKIGEPEIAAPEAEAEAAHEIQGSPESRLPEAFQPPKPKIAPPSGTADNPFRGGPISREPLPEAEVTPTPEPAPKIAAPKLKEQIGNQLNRSLGNEPPKITPGKPIYQGPRPLPRPAAPANGELNAPPVARDVPAGMTPVESTAIKAYSYDEATKTFSAQMQGGAIHKWGEVTPEEAEAFKNADSKGKALAEIRNNHVGLGADYGKGFIARKPAMRSAAPEDDDGATIARINANAESFAKDMEKSRKAEPEGDDEDLTPILRNSVKAAKAARIARPN
jgi:hypothetical protein